MLVDCLGAVLDPFIKGRLNVIYISPIRIRILRTSMVVNIGCGCQDYMQWLNMTFYVTLDTFANYMKEDQVFYCTIQNEKELFQREFC